MYYCLIEIIAINLLGRFVRSNHIYIAINTYYVLTINIMLILTTLKELSIIDTLLNKSFLDIFLKGDKKNAL